MIFNFYKRTFCKLTSPLMLNKANFHEKHFIDKVRLKVIAGNGGDGAITFYRDREI